ncbi:hypothetical protein HYFRA_00013260 [Hymenoscyphus fraxineus]|uniref:Phytanoyl-CoA dioxygenase family protein n=1 Tax=Hymenoscyphus fraxineus TaxID=746836 RepID=A0A9N9PNS7_9HELO|nr:hypothetical protein HYFRA_00013260 [Hymenoscyphus fraxineus]
MNGTITTTTNSANGTEATKKDLLDSLNRDGFVHIPSLLTPEQIQTLRTATTEVINVARAGKWPHVRTLPKQFPPWPIEPGANPAANGIWGVQFLMHPSMPHAQTFIKNYFSNEIVEVVKELLQCSDDELVLELFNMLVRPDEDFELIWHRDDIPWKATKEEEEERLGVGKERERAWHAQWNLALYDDASLIVIPGSHARAKTEQERNAGPHETGLPGEITVLQKAGDILFYDNNILHRGKYDKGKERATLHGTMGRAGGSRDRARNVLQHGIGEWVAEIDLSALEGREKERAEGMRERLLAMGTHSGEYSLEG